MRRVFSSAGLINATRCIQAAPIAKVAALRAPTYTMMYAIHTTSVPRDRL